MTDTGADAAATRCCLCTGAGALLQRAIGNELARRAKQVWAPPFCNTDGLQWRDGSWTLQGKRGMHPFSSVSLAFPSSTTPASKGWLRRAEEGREGSEIKLDCGSPQDGCFYEQRRSAIRRSSSRLCLPSPALRRIFLRLVLGGG